ncbi:pseudouridine synthase [Alicyclobacillus fodiniaquatilis]|jgi:16S rRNA pseudouridine516 synthase|uniref:Pseudouridine synthase n=1 Tax=Alicyclobacillus fodiniaquatilis TaxID=1661150 RepID=A0ABW4JDU8_9BACL
MKAMRLDKWLAHTGVGTRTEVKKAIRAQRVMVNGEVARDPGAHVTPGVDTVEFDGEALEYQAHAYFMMYKPQGVLSATEDVRDPVVTDLLAPQDAHFAVFPVGRLDKDAEGLLLLTNDGQLTHQLLAPKKHVAKIYYVEVTGTLTQQDVDAMEKGIVLEDGYQSMPAMLEIIEADLTSSARITIYEGKFHQIKRMFDMLGKPVTFLKRLQMGPLVLDEALQPGEYRPLTEQECNALQRINPA